MSPTGPEGHAGGAAVPVTELTYGEASRELEAIVALFEHGDLDVDQLVGYLERATAIVAELDRRLRRTKTQVEDLVPRLEAALVLNERDDDNEDADAGPPGEERDEIQGLF